MPLTLISGPANAGKAQAVMDAVRAELAAGRQPLLVVPTGADVQRYTRELSGDGALIGARVTRFGGLLGEAGPALGDARPGAARARPRAADRGRQPPHAASRRPARQALSAGLSRAVRELIDDLHAGAVTPARLQAALAKLDAGEPGEGSSHRRLAALYSGYEAELARLGMPDAQQRRLRALAAIRADPSLWGSHARAALRLRRPQPAAARGGAHARRGGSAGDRVAELRGGPHGVRRPGRHL